MAISIKDLLSKTINQAGIGVQVEAAVACDQFNHILLEILGERAKDKSRALYVKNKTLTVAVTSSSWGQEIKLNEHEILQKLGQKIGTGKVERLRFFV